MQEITRQAALKKIFPGLAFILLSALFFLSNTWRPGEFLWIRIPLLLLICFLCPLQLLRKPFRSVKILALVCIWFFFIAEGICMFLPVTYGPGGSLGSKLWFKKYWTPVNSLGFREREPEKNNKKQVLVIGDSFTAAQGIENTADRFTEVFAKYSADSIAVWNWGECGADTRKEWENYKKFPFQPDVIVLQWFVNDIEGISAERGKRFQHPWASGWRKQLRRLARHSYSLDLIFTFLSSSSDFGYYQWLDSVYSDKEILAGHLSDIRLFADACTAKNIRFVFLPLPFLADPERSERFIRPVMDFAHEQDWEVIDPFPLLETLPPADRIVSRFDQHPGEKMHAVLGKELARKIAGQNN